MAKGVWQLFSILRRDRRCHYSTVAPPTPLPQTCVSSYVNTRRDRALHCRSVGGASPPLSGPYSLKDYLFDAPGYGTLSGLVLDLTYSPITFAALVSKWGSSDCV